MATARRARTSPSAGSPSSAARSQARLLRAPGSSGRAPGNFSTLPPPPEISLLLECDGQVPRRGLVLRVPSQGFPQALRRRPRAGRPRATGCPRAVAPPAHRLQAPGLGEGRRASSKRPCSMRTAARAPSRSGTREQVWTRRYAVSAPPTSSSPARTRPRPDHARGERGDAHRVGEEESHCRARRGDTRRDRARTRPCRGGGWRRLPRRGVAPIRSGSEGPQHSTPRARRARNSRPPRASRGAGPRPAFPGSGTS
jgi:hypothetical protein